jgi:hypothetical protein
MCPHTTIYVSLYSYICVLRCGASICVLILLYMCPHTIIYVSSYSYMCPHTTIYVSSYSYYMSPQVWGVKKVSSSVRYSLFTNEAVDLSTSFKCVPPSMLKEVDAGLKMSAAQHPVTGTIYVCVCVCVCLYIYLYIYIYIYIDILHIYRYI